ncbi:hypothetical protein JaAD80_27770 [Janthinobacterium sp. AD80]|nr:hypothetical protein JaAD80_27770 [Janthinobacterium sp. AD80]
MAQQRRFDALRTRRALFQDVLAGHGAEAHEQRITPCKVRMAQHMGCHQGVFRHRVVFRHVGMAGVAWEHDLKNMRMAHLLVHELMNVAHAKRPVAHAHWQAVNGDLRHETVGYEFKVDRGEFQAQFQRQRLDARRMAGQGAGRCTACAWQRSAIACGYLLRRRSLGSARRCTRCLARRRITGAAIITVAASPAHARAHATTRATARAAAHAAMYASIQAAADATAMGSTPATVRHTSQVTIHVLDTASIHAVSSWLAASCWKKVRMAAHTSSGLARMLLCSGKPWRACSAHRRCISVSRLRGTPGTVST